MTKVLNEKISRRSFFTKTGGAVTGTAAASLVISTIFNTKDTVAKQTVNTESNDTLTMLSELKEALKKPIEKRKWAMVIDTRKCIGCSGCTVACIAQNNLPSGVTYRVVPEVEDGEYPDLKRFFMPTNCMQCEKPTCVDAANKIIPGSMSVRPDGIVTIDYNKMKGKKVFQTAKKACPYSNALYYDEGKNYTDNTPAIQPYEKMKSKEYGKEFSRKETKGATRKCHFCIDRIENGTLPACVATCTGQAMYFGDANNPASIVSQYIKSKQSFVLNAGAKTSPAVRFVHDNPDETCLKCHE
jgi:molybdopterin-containing oxidoreductase family iron-sulfur binding subunit